MRYLAVTKAFTVLSPSGNDLFTKILLNQTRVRNTFEFAGCESGAT